jgi:hypothetical protein
MAPERSACDTLLEQVSPTLKNRQQSVFEPHATGIREVQPYVR